ncbi:MAG: patatin-like phospholipase family protein [Bacilli bacterium]|nr:patatin-like phospholipase family protein [Bacilli bacterium]
MKRALVLSGGGAKGSYELGVYKALMRLGIKIDIITGTSIGALNGAVLCTGDYRRAKKLWLKMSSNEVFNYTFKKTKEYPKIAKDIIKNKGLKFDKAEAILSSVLDENRIRKSKIDFGLVTFNLKNRVPKALTKDQIPKGKLVPYIIASATCFPMVEVKKIDGEAYVDGGYYDNLPINLAIDMGADEIIAVDLSAIGLKQKVKDEDIKIDYIKKDNKSEFILDFDPESAKRNIKVGYNDTMKHFKKMDGNKYTFKKGHLTKNYNNISDYYIKLLKKILISDESKIKLTNILKNRRYQNIFLNIKQGKSLEKEVNSSLEYLGSLFDLDTDCVYSIEKFNRKLIREAKSLNYITLDKNLKGKMLIGYIYNKYMDSTNKDSVYKRLFNIALIFQKDFLAALYLIAISNRYPITLKSDKFFDEILNSIKKDVK